MGRIALALAILISVPSTGVGQSAQAREHRTVEEIFTLGGVDAPTEAAFRWEPDLLVDRHGNLYARAQGGGDPEDGSVLAAKVFDTVITGFSLEGELMSYTEDAAGFPTLELVSIRLDRGDL